MLVSNNCFKHSGYHKAAEFIKNYVHQNFYTIGPLIVTLFALALVYLLVVLVAFIIRIVKKAVQPCLPVF
jgi:hypothetical protein